MFQKINKKLILGVVIFFLVILSIFPRAVDVLNQNPIFGLDQGREMIAAKNIVVNHKPILIGTELGANAAGVQGLFHGPMYYYILTIPFLLFNGNPVGAVWLMLFFGILTVLLGYYAGKKIFGAKRWGLVAAFLIAISPILIAQSRFQWSPNPPTFFILLSFYFTYYLNGKNKINIFLASFFAAFVYNFELAIAVPISLALLIYSFYIFRKNLINYLWLFLGYVVAFVPMVLFEIRHNFMGARGLIAYLSGHLGSSSSFNVLPDHMQSFIYNFKDTFPVNNLYFAIPFAIFVLALSIYMLTKEKDKNLKHFISFLIFLVPVNFFVFYFLKNTVWNYYLTDLNVSYILILTYLFFSFRKFKNIYLKNSLFLLLFVFFVLAFVSSIKTSINDYKDYGGMAKVKGKVDALDYIYKNSGGKPFGLLVFSPPVYTYPYDYLIWWYGAEKYNYIPHQEKKGTFYLLIEPDSAKPWTYRGWLETVIKTGKIKETTTLPSGFIVQKRVDE